MTPQKTPGNTRTVLVTPEGIDRLAAAGGCESMTEPVTEHYGHRIYKMSGAWYCDDRDGETYPGTGSGLATRRDAERLAENLWAEGRGL